jgi:hypothetical protein
VLKWWGTTSFKVRALVDFGEGESGRGSWGDNESVSGYQILVYRYTGGL